MTATERPRARHTVHAPPKADPCARPIKKRSAGIVAGHHREIPPDIYNAAPDVKIEPNGTPRAVSRSGLRDLPVVAVNAIPAGS